MAQAAQQNIDARYSTNIKVGRDQVIHHYTISQVECRPSNLPSSSLSFNDAPIDLLSSHFTGREEELDHTENIFRTSHGSAPTRFAIWGIPGIGKSQLVLQYVKLSYDWQKYSVIFWISGATIEKLNQGFAKLLALVGHPDRDHPEQWVRLSSARRWLEESDMNGHFRWLLVLDNVGCEAVDFLREHLPRKHSTAHILLTTRTKAIAEAATTVAGQQHQILELRAPNLNDATNQLLREAGINTGDPPLAAINGAERLAKSLGCLPLAISQAASFAKQSHKNLDDVLGLYQSKHKFEVSFNLPSLVSSMLMNILPGKLLSWNDNLSSYEQKSVAVTFAIQLDELDRQSPICSNLLKVLSFFDAENIPLAMITDAAEDLRSQSTLDSKSSDVTVSPNLDSLIALMCSPVQLQHAIRQLHDFSLVGYESTQGTIALRIHDLVQIMIQESTRIDGRQDQWFHIARELACNAFRHIEDPVSHRCWVQCETLSPHIQNLTKWDDEHSVGNSELDDANIGLAQYLSSRGRYDEAELLVGRVLACREKQFGPEHPGALVAMKNLATVYRLQGRYKEAETLYGRVLAGTEKLGPEHPDTLRAMHHLAIVYRLQGKYKEAEARYRRVLAGKVKLLGSDHPDTLATMNNLAIVHRSQGRYEEAEILYKRALTGREKLLGPEHPDTLQTMNNLAVVYDLQGRHSEAEMLYGQALVGKEKVLGPEHPDTLQTVNNLAIAYDLQGRFSDAETLFQRALAGNEKVLGLEHPDTLQTVGNLANIYHSQGRYEEAETLHEQSLAGYEAMLGPEHPDTLRTVRRLVKLFIDQGRHEQAVLVQDRYSLPSQ